MDRSEFGPCRRGSELGGDAASRPAMHELGISSYFAGASYSTASSARVAGLFAALVECWDDRN